MMDLEETEHTISQLKLLGSKGTTGTQASFVELFDGDLEKVDRLDPMIAEKMGFSSCYPVSGQTYSRKVDTFVLNTLAGIAASAMKMATDIRLLQQRKSKSRSRKTRSVPLRWRIREIRCAVRESALCRGM